MTYDPQEFVGIQWFDFAAAPLQRSDPHLGRFIRKLRGGAERDGRQSC
jgi:8-oxo-dGTP diphosphatase